MFSVLLLMFSPSPFLFCSVFMCVFSIVGGTVHRFACVAPVWSLATERPRDDFSPQPFSLSRPGRDCPRYYTIRYDTIPYYTILYSTLISGSVATPARPRPSGAAPAPRFNAARRRAARDAGATTLLLLKTQGMAVQLIMHNASASYYSNAMLFN